MLLLHAAGRKCCIQVACRVTQLEADRLEEERDQRERFKQQFRAELERQAKEKNVHITLPDDK